MVKLVNVRSEDVLLTNATIIPGGGANAINSGAILIGGSKILDIGDSKDLESKYSNLDYRHFDFQGYLITPGFVNAHTHCSMSFFRGLGHAAAVTENAAETMIETFFYPAERSLTPDLIEPLAYSYLYDNLRSGVTCIADAYFYAGGVAKAVDRFGMRAFIGEHIADLGGAMDAGEPRWQEVMKLIENWNHSSRVQPMVYAHATDTVSFNLLKKLGNYARVHNLPFHMHLSQSLGEYQRVYQRENMSPVSYAQKAEVLGPRSLLVHLLSAKEDDWKVIKDSGSTAVICPISEMIYESLPDLEMMETLGVSYCLGTDSPASNDGADILAEARFHSLLLKNRGISPSHYQASRILNMITEGGAKAFGLNHLGCLKPGNLADLVCFQIDLGALPVSFPEETLLYSMGSRHVCHVMVDGQWVLWDRRLTKISEAELTQSYLAAVDAIKRLSNLP